MNASSLKGGLRSIPLLALAGLLVACGGKDDDSGGFTNGVDASGVWLGTAHVDGGTQDVGALLIVRPDGTAYLDSGIALLVGDAETHNGAFSADADGYSYVQAFPNGSDFSLNGTVAAGTSITGAFSGSGNSGTFAFAYNAHLSTLAAAVSSIAGTMASRLWVANTSTPVSVTIGTNGDLDGSNAGCTIDGTVSVRDAARNIYNWAATLQGCAANGSASGIGIGGDGGKFHFVGTLNGGAIYLSSFDTL